MADACSNPCTLCQEEGVTDPAVTWCTECETTFSWNTGHILVNVQVHNPHFYARQREIQNGNMILKRTTKHQISF